MQIWFWISQQYSINKPKILLGFVGQPWQQHVVAEMDSALNKWVDSVPDHRTSQTFLPLPNVTYIYSSVRWDPNREDDNSFNQSVFLYTTYYYIQMIIHRPFISSPRKPSPLSFPSLAICTNAARSCSHIVDIQRKRNSNPPPQILVHVVSFAFGEPWCPDFVSKPLTTPNRCLLSPLGLSFS